MWLFTELGWVFEILSLYQTICTFVLILFHLKSVHQLQQVMSIPSLVELGVVFFVRLFYMLHLANHDHEKSCVLLSCCDLPLLY